MQKTITKTVDISGVGLHKGQPANLCIMPAPIDHGIIFERVDIRNRKNSIPARYNNVTDTRLNTRLGGDVSVSTIEHLMAAFAGLGLTNLLVQIDGPEVPILDGSSQEFVRCLFDAGIVEQNAPAAVFRITKPVRAYGDDGAYAELLPADNFSITFDINFDKTVIGHQELALVMNNGVFLRELSDCRTFVRAEDVAMLKRNGLALGGGHHNAVVVDGMKVENTEGFRRTDEAVRHKMLDALGDLYLIGGFIMGAYHGHRAGHHLTNQLLRKAFAENAISCELAGQEQISKLPGFDIHAGDFVAA